MKQLIYFLLSIVFFSSCTDKEELLEIEFDTITDIQGNIYKTVKVGDQWWMAENLKTTQFRTGEFIPELSTNEQWELTTQPGFCNYNNQTQNTGLLYNFYVVEDPRNIAPEGWHIPTDEEWKRLEAHIGLALDELDDVNWRGLIEGDLLKQDSLLEWSQFDDVWPTDQFGFSAQAGSSRFYEGDFGIPGLKRSGFWWSSTKTESEAWYRYLDYKKSGIFRYFGNPNYGFSIRCVKDN